MSKKHELSRRQFGKTAIGGISALLAACTALPQPKQAKPLQVPPVHPMSVEVPISNKKLKITFNFGFHLGKSDADTIVPVLKKVKPHVVCIEEAFSSEKGSQEIEESYLRGEEFSHNTFHKRLIQKLRENKVTKIYLLERYVPPNQFTPAQYVRAMAQGSNKEARYHFFNGHPDGAIRMYRQDLWAHTESVLERERGAKEVIQHFYDSLTKRYPELKKESEIRVVVRYGASHTPLYRHAKLLDFGEVSREMQGTPFYYFPGIAYSRRATFQRKKFKLNKQTGKIEETGGLWPADKIDDVDVARTFLGDALAYHAIINLDVNFANAAAFANLFSKNLTLDHFRNISKRLGKMKLKTKLKTYDQGGNELVEAMHRDGIKVPRTKQEIHAFLEERRIPLARD